MKEFDRPNFNPVYITQPDLPPLEEFVESLKAIWDSRILTNNGPFHQQLERELAAYLGVKYISLFSNGTLALITALKALEITGEVITTPFSFVATTHALWWNNIKPIFIDIEPDTYTLDPEKIISAITPKTTAILPVHVYGYPCNVDRIKEIADTYKLKVLYDACHTFGVSKGSIPILNYGDLSVMSFHATKVFNTFEGGAIVCHDEIMKKRIDHLKNFGFANETSVLFPGINAKMNEFQAALGVLQLKYVDSYIQKRKENSLFYRKQLANIPGVILMDETKDVEYCYSYFPILINQSVFGRSRDQLYEELKNMNIHVRRYFYPLISHFSPYKNLETANPNNLPVAERIASEVLCLPIYPELDTSILIKICSLLTQS